MLIEGNSPGTFFSGAEKHYSELLKYFENNPTFFNEGDLEHFLAIKSKMDLIRNTSVAQSTLENYLIK